MLHIYHASCALALNLVIILSFDIPRTWSVFLMLFPQVRHRTRGGPRADPPWALDRIDLILQMLGDRAKNSILRTLLLHFIFV